MENDRVKRPFLDPFSKWYARLTITLGTIIAAMLITPLFANPIAYSLPFFWFFFPSGLCHIINDIYYGQSDIILGWLLYAGIIVLATLSRNRKFFYVIYVILIIILILNVKGCSEMRLEGSQ